MRRSAFAVALLVLTAAGCGSTGGSGNGIDVVATTTQVADLVSNVGGGRVALQSRVLDIAAELVRPGGTLVYAVCSLLSREGAGQIGDFISRRSSWIVQETPIAAGRLDGAGKLLTPAHDGTDGFFVARLGSPC